MEWDDRVCKVEIDLHLSVCASLCGYNPPWDIKTMTKYRVISRVDALPTCPKVG